MSNFRDHQPQTSTADPVGPDHPALKPVRRVVVVAAATVAALLVWAVGRGFLGHPPSVAGSGGNQSVGVLNVVLVAVVVGVLANVAVAILDRYAGDRRWSWPVLAGGVGLLSLLGPLSQARGGSAVVLVGIHVAVAACLLIGLRPTARRGRPIDKHAASPR